MKILPVVGQSPSHFQEQGSYSLSATGYEKQQDEQIGTVAHQASY